MTDTSALDLYCLGNAIVDVLAPSTDAFLLEHSIIKSAMNLIDAERAELLYEAMGPATVASGGSAGNTAAGAAMLGTRTAFGGKVARDELGAAYTSDIRKLGVAFDTEPLDAPPPTARSFIFVTPDAQRSMNTYLGACTELSTADVEPSKAAGAAITYFEGYLWDAPEAKAMIRETAEIAKAAGRSVAMTLSDSFCVERFRDEFLDLIESGTVDTVFANADELCALFVTDLDTAMRELASRATLAVVTNGAFGSTALRGDERVAIKAHRVRILRDTTGAGDLYAAGFLSALVRGRDLEACGKLGSFAAAHVIERIGPRPEADFLEKARLAGVL